MDDKEILEKRIERLMLPVETQIMMCDDERDLCLLAVGMLRKVILIFDNHYQQEARKTLIDTFNK